jgi:uncharacterized protein (UPF0332 family)
MLDVKAEENWRAYQNCMSERCYNAAASRLYYSVFQVIFLWAQKKKNYKDNPVKSIHAEMIGLVNKIVDQQEMPFTLNDLRELRELRRVADYERDMLNRDEIVRHEPLANIMRMWFLKEIQR